MEDVSLKWINFSLLLTTIPRNIIENRTIHMIKSKFEHCQRKVKQKLLETTKRKAITTRPGCNRGPFLNFPPNCREFPNLRKWIWFSPCNGLHNTCLNLINWNQLCSSTKNIIIWPFFYVLTITSLFENKMRELLLVLYEKRTMIKEYGITLNS